MGSLRHRVGRFEVRMSASTVPTSVIANVLLEEGGADHVQSHPMWSFQSLEPCTFIVNGDAVGAVHIHSSPWAHSLGPFQFLRVASPF